MTDTMQAVRFHGPRDVRVETVVRPELTGPSDVRVRVEAAGICGSDLHVYETGVYVTRIPVIMGHEYAGTVVEVGPEVEGLQPGDRVIGDSRIGCGDCGHCRAGRPNLCAHIGFLGEVRDGCYAEEVVVDRSLLVKIDREVPPELAALAEPLAVALHAVGRLGSLDGARVLVLGAGPVGALIHATLKTRGLANVYITDVSEYRRRVLRGRHPESLIDPEGTYDVVFETTGAEKVVADILPDLVTPRGELVMVGLFSRPVPFDFNRIVEGEWTVHGCAAFDLELADAARLLETNGPDFSHTVSHELPLGDAQEAFDILTSPEKKAMKIVFKP